MASASLKERMRQLQALKTSVEMKSQAVLAREKELAQLAQQSSVRKLNLESLPDDDQTIGADTQTTAGETAASPATPLPPPLGMEEESSKPDPPPEDFPPDEKEETSRAATPSDEIPQEKDQEVSFPEQPPGLIQGVESDETTLSQQLHDVIPTTEENESSKLETPEEASQRTEEDEFEEVEEEEEEEEEEMGGDGVEEEVGGDDVDEEEDVEIIEETEVVEGDTEGIDIEDHEEYVEVFDDEDEEYEEVEDSILEDTIKKIVSDAQTSQAPQITDEKEHDEFAWGRYPVVDKRRLTEATEEQDEEAPMDEMQYLRQQSAGDSPFDEETSEPLPVFQALDEDEEASVRTPVTQVPDEDEEASRELPIFQALEVEEQEQEESETRIPEAEITATNHPSKSQVSVTSDIETGAVPSRSSRSGGLPKDFDDEGKRRWRFIICCLLLVGACAITALVLPFVLDYNEDKDLSRVTPSPTISPAPTMEPSGSPTLLPTISPAPTRSPSVRPSTSPTLSRAPTNIPTASPTRTPTIPATPAPITPTTAPISPTRVPVTPTSAPAAPSTQSPTTLRLGNLISVFLVPLSGEEVFTDQSSPQFQAARYIADDDDFSSELTGEITLAERYALITLYFAAGGENWNQCNLGDTSCAGPWLTGDACDWTFITCNQDGRVSTINFGDGETPVGLSGFIPPEISILAALEDLSIVNESISGTIPDGLSTLGDSLLFLRLQDNALTGSVPASLGQLVNLSVMNLQGNSLVGSIDPDICALRTNNLQDLTVDCDEITCSCCTQCFR